MAEVTRVPKIATRAPNCLVTGFHSVLDRNPRPNLLKAGRPPMNREAVMALTTRSTNRANARVAFRNRASASLLRPVPVPDTFAVG